GVCWNTTGNPTTSNFKTIDGSGNGTFTSSITGLTVNTTYYVRAYATNSTGTAYGSQLSFTATATATVSDYDGNVYHTVTIGTQVWMVENLKTTHYNDGTTIPLVTDTTSWNNLSTPAYCWYNNSSSYKTTYGALYNWYTVNTGKLAPTGWRVPTDADWTILSAYLGGVSVAGGKLKESGTSHWQSPNTGATNESGFTALPGGWRNLSPTLYYSLGYDATWWSTTEGISGGAWCRDMSYNDASFVSGNYNKNYGFSVRCVKN
ncbi:MAG: fibrobacter succinogenes major paralogous domain-containing protein, partial [Paludibacter sp.]